MSLQKLRMSAGLSQEQVADELKISRTTVTMWETGCNKPRADKLPALARLYGCTIDDLFRKEDTENDNGL